MKKLSSYLNHQISEINNSLQLRIYGLCLALTHLWTFLYWNKRGFFVNAQSSNNVEPLCFPFFPDCDLFRESISPGVWQIILYAYLFVGVFTAICYFQKRLNSIGYWFLIVATFFKLFLHLSNYNFMGNYHYMVHFVSLAFLFLPNKLDIPKYLIVGFYIAAGFLKINIDWLSGAAMIRTPYITGNFLSFSLYYVIFLELIFVFGLIHPNKWVRWGALAQFLFFHAFSWHIVGFFYPMVMFSLLGTFLVEEYFLYKDKGQIKNRLLNLVSGKETKTVYGVLALFTFLQVLPFTMVSDPSLSGVARLSSLNMFDSKTKCHSLMVAKTKNGSFHIRPNIKNLGVRLRCDPLVFLNQAHQLCRKNKEFQEIEKLSLHLFTRRITSHRYKKVLAIDDVCQLNSPLWGELGGKGS